MSAMLPNAVDLSSSEVPPKAVVGARSFMSTKRGDGTARALLYEAANSILTRFKGSMKLKSWALSIAERSGLKKARVALARRLAVIMHAMMMDGTEFAMS